MMPKQKINVEIDQEVANTMLKALDSLSLPLEVEMNFHNFVDFKGVSTITFEKKVL